MLNLAKLDPLELMHQVAQNPTPVKLKILTQFVNWFVPFNKPHKFDIVDITEDSLEVKLPYKRINLNHVKSMHACAQATLGELCSGILILKNIGFKKYRMILSELHFAYTYQGKTDLTGKVEIPNSEFERVFEALKTQDSETLVAKTLLYDENSNLVCTVTANWQIKEWKKAKVKRS